MVVLVKIATVALLAKLLLLKMEVLHQVFRFCIRLTAMLMILYILVH